MKRLALLAPLVLSALACGPSVDPLAIVEDQRIAGSDLLAKALDSKEPAERLRALVAMGRIQSPTYVEPLVRAVSLRDPELRHAALFALGQLALVEGPRLPHTIHAALRRALRYQDDETVALAVEALGKLGEPPLAHTIGPLLAHASARVRAEAALALFRSRFVPVLRDGADPPPALPESALAALVAAFADDSPAVRRAAVYACSRYGEPQAVPGLIARLEDDDPEVRLFAARALGHSGDAGAVDPLLRSALDPSDQVRTEAVLAVAALGGAARLPPALTADGSFHVRAALAAALAGPAAVEPLGALERDPSPAVRAAAIAGLARARGADYLDPLAQHLAAGEVEERLAAIRAAGEIGAAARAIVDGALGDPDPRLRAAALEALGRIGEGAAPAVRAALASTDLALRGTAVEVLGRSGAADLGTLLPSLYEASAGDEWIEVRTSLIDALSAAGARAVVWKAAQHDPSRAVRDRALASIRRRTWRTPPEGAPPPAPSAFLGRAPAADAVVRIETSKGPIELRLLAADAPVHVASFLALVERKFYDGLSWHRLVSNFVVQGGDPRGDGWGGPGYALRDEINRVRFERGTVGLAKSGRDTAGCQIFITHVPTPHLDGTYTAFAQVTSGMDVVDRLEAGDRIVKARRDRD